MAADLCFAIPGDLATLTGGYGYDRRLIAGLRALGWEVRHLALGPGFPFPDASDLSAAARDLAGLADASLVLLDGLAFGAMPEIAAAEGTRLRLVALVHHPLAEETGLGAEAAAALRESERRALACTRGVIATSATTARRLVEAYGAAPDRMAVARPGSDPAAALERVAARDGPVELLSIGTLTYRKGHDLLIEALAQLADLPWVCRIVGSADRAPAIADDLRRRIADRGLRSRIRLEGETADLAPFYRAADLFVLASRHEGYGMVFAEAMRRGLPIIATAAGAVGEVVPPEAGILVAPEDVAALADALRQMIGDRALRARYAAVARATALSLPSWDDTARAVADALRRFRDLPRPPEGSEGSRGTRRAQRNRQSNSMSSPRR